MPKVIIQTEIKPDQIRHLAFGLNPLTTVLRARNVDVDAMLSKAMIPKNALGDPDYQLTPAQELSFMESTIETLDEPGFGLEIGLKYHLSSYGLLGLALISSPNLKEALTLLFRYILMTWTYMHWSVSTQDGVAILSPRTTRDLGSSHQYMIDRGLAASYNICREALGCPLPILEVNLTQPEPSYAQKYRDIFDCPVHFEQPSNDYRFDEAYLTQPQAQADPESARVFALQCEKICQRLEQGSSFTETVRQHLLEPGNKIRRLDTVAKRLYTTPRTIQRKLSAEGTSFNAILEDVRKNISIEYLETTNLSIEEIAIRLGYSDAPNFSHAFKKWTGTSPGIYRKQNSHRS
jgi:AraC-like DNA-binding protein